MFHVNANLQQDIEASSSNLNDIEAGVLRQRHSQFHEHKLLEKYFRETHLLKLIEGSARNFVEQIRRTRQPEDLLAPLQMRLDIVYGELVNRSPQLLYLLVEEPLQFYEAVKYTTYGLVRDQLRQAGQKPIDIGQLHTHCRVIGIPFHPNLQFNPGQQALRLGLSLVQGILSAYTPQETLVLQTIWFCGSGCLRNALQTSSTDAPLCASCSRPMSEYQKLRVTENYRLLAILPSSCAETPRIQNCAHRPVLVRARAHTYDCDLKLGASYLVTGQFPSKSNTYQFEACHLKRS